ncbi:SMP-30/gluconolactonase/LRE family protein [Maricaulis maris]|uniref:SMP-30/gluconolactonase/LRE family protein n=1 Tax=Maricaulis maris TaxID=74318 RepID=UPI003B8C3AB3
MKTTFLAAGIALAGASACAQDHPTAIELWRTDSVARPEAVHVPDGSDWAYIGNQGPASESEEPQATGYVSRLNLVTGEWQARWVEGYVSPLGIVSANDRLFMIEAARTLVAMDLETGAELDRWDFAHDDVVLNDIAIDPSGRVWITDTRGGALYTLTDGLWEQVFNDDRFTGANGVEYVDGSIYVVSSSGEGRLIRIDPGTLEATVLLENEGSLDGVVTDGRGGLVLSDLRGRLLHWSDEHGLTVLDAFDGEDIMLNSIGGTPDGRFIFSPHWETSELSAHEIRYPDANGD